MVKIMPLEGEEVDDMQIILPHSHYDPEHLDRVMREMQTLGAPTLRGVWVECWGAWVALEGSHRLRAAHALGLTPEMVQVEYDDETTASHLDLDRGDDNPRITDLVDNASRGAFFLNFNS